LDIGKPRLVCRFAQSHRIVIMNLGVIEQIGTPIEVYRYPKSHFVANFIGRANFVPGTVADVKRDQLTIKALGNVLTLPNLRPDLLVGDSVTVVIRPEAVKVQQNNGGFEGSIKRSVYLGNVIEYDMLVSDQIITGVETDPSRMQLIPVGSKVSVQFMENYIQVLPSDNKNA